METHLQNQDKLSTTTNATSQVNSAKKNLQVLTQQTNEGLATRFQSVRLWLFTFRPNIWSAIRNILVEVCCISKGVLPG